MNFGLGTDLLFPDTGGGNFITATTVRHDINGSISISGSITPFIYDPRVKTNNLVDFWKFTIPEGQGFLPRNTKIRLENSLAFPIGSSSSLTFQIYDSQYRLVNQPLELSTAYYVKIFPKDGVTVSVNYNLNISLQKAPVLGDGITTYIGNSIKASRLYTTLSYGRDEKNPSRSIAIRDLETGSNFVLLEKREKIESIRLKGDIFPGSLTFNAEADKVTFFIQGEGDLSLQTLTVDSGTLDSLAKTALPARYILALGDTSLLIFKGSSDGHWWELDKQIDKTDGSIIEYTASSPFYSQDPKLKNIQVTGSSIYVISDTSIRLFNVAGSSMTTPNSGGIFDTSSIYNYTIKSFRLESLYFPEFNLKKNIGVAVGATKSSGGRPPLIGLQHYVESTKVNGFVYLFNSGLSVYEKLTFEEEIKDFSFIEDKLVFWGQSSIYTVDLDTTYDYKHILGSTLARHDIANSLGAANAYHIEGGPGSLLVTKLFYASDTKPASSETVEVFFSPIDRALLPNDRFFGLDENQNSIVYSSALFSIEGRLTVDSNIRVQVISIDPDGSNTSDFYHTWQASANGSSWANIGTGTELIIAKAQEGQQLRFITKYIDGQGFPEEVTTTVGTVPYVNDGQATFSISGAPAIGQTLTATVANPDPDGNGSFSYTWQASANGTSWTTIATGVELSIAQAQEGQQLRLLPAYTDGQGFSESVTTAAGTVPFINNDQATVSITGMRAIGATLAAAVDSADPDGNGSGGFSFTWQVSTDGNTWANVSTNSASYTIATADEGKQLRLLTAYTDAQNFSESVTTAAGTVAAFDNGDASFSITGTRAVGQILSAAASTADPDGNGSGGFSYTWQSSINGITWANVGTNSSTYTIAAADDGKQLRLLASYTDAQNFSETVTTSAGTVAFVDNGDAVFSITGTRAVGQTLTAAVATADPDGNGSGTFSYTWQSSTDGTTWANVGTNSASYTIATADEGKQLRLLTAYTDAQNFSESVTTAAGTVAAFDNGDASFSITGTRAVGQILSAAASTADPDGNGSGGFSYTWQSSINGITWANVGTNSSTYTIAAADDGKQLRLLASYTDAQNFSETVTTSAGTVAFVDNGDAVFSITGTRAVGQILTAAVATADPDGNGSGAFSYTWQSSTNGTTWGNVGTNSASYTIAAADEGRQLRLLASYTDARNFSETVTTSAGTIPFVDNGDSSFSITGTPGVGNTLTATTTTADPDGNGVFTYAWQTSKNGTTWSPVGTNSSSYTVAAGDEGKGDSGKPSLIAGQ